MNDDVAVEVKQGELVQEVFFPNDASIDSLYLRYLAGYMEIADDVLKMEKGSKVSFNTFFNSFYESYWAEISSTGDIFLEIDFSGSILLEVFRDTKHNGCNKIAFIRLDSESPETKYVPLGSIFSDVGESGRVFVDITARKKAEIAGLRFKTNTPPKRQPKISIGICTFNREKFLLRNLRAMLALPSLNEGLVKIIVANQGPPFADPYLVELANDSERVLLVEQGNLGGCGGFTRTMYEALNLEGITHHVLMDDDVLIDARVLQNLISLLAYIKDDVVIGGLMLDMLRPNFLYEAGAQVRSNTRIKSLHHNIDLRALDALIPFNKYHSVDYNAWWFCTIPIGHIREAEFPAPIFIRGDDMEYGLRLQERGVKTIAMPGIAVWHEPFYVKVGGWQTYYDLRNRLILASTYPHRFKLESSIDVLWWMLNAVASHDYLSATLLAKAVRDFLRGPEFFDIGADTIHAEVALLAKSLAQPSVAKSEIPAPPGKLRRMPKSDWALGLLVTYRIAMTILFGKKGGAMLLHDHEANLSNIGPRPYVKTNGIGSYRLLFEPDRPRLMRALADSFGAWRAYRRQRHAAAAAWGQQVPQLRSRDAWQAIFETDAAKREAASISAGAAE